MKFGSIKITNRGFSLVELLLVLSIVIAFALWAMPSQKVFLNRAKEKSLQQQLVRSLQFARNAAITSHIVVTFCRSADLHTCSNSEETDYIVRSPESVLSVFHDAAKEGRLHWRGAKAATELSFLPTGFTHNENGTFWFCGKNAKNPEWAVVVNKVGRVRSIEPNKQGVIWDSKGKLLSC